MKKFIMMIMFLCLLIPSAAYATHSQNYRLYDQVLSNGGCPAESVTYSQQSALIGLPCGSEEGSSSLYARKPFIGLLEWDYFNQHVPSILQINPKSNRWTEEEIVAYTVVAADREDDPIEYQFKLDDDIRQPYSSQNQSSFVVDMEDTGRHAFVAEARDTESGIAQQQFDVFMYRKPKMP